MSDGTEDGLPPLGTPSPGRPIEGKVRGRRPGVLAVVAALVVGLVAGFAMGRVGGDDAGGKASTTTTSIASRAATTAPATTEATLSEACVTTIRSAQQALALLDQGLKNLRELRFAEVDAAMQEMQRLRGRLDGRVRECLGSVGR